MPCPFYFVSVDLKTTRCLGKGQYGAVVNSVNSEARLPSVLRDSASASLLCKVGVSPAFVGTVASA